MAVPHLSGAPGAERCADVGLAQVLVDVNWRPVFWEGHEDAPARIKEYVDKADIIKLSEEEAEFIYGVPCNDALFDPIQVGCASHHDAAGGAGRLGAG